MTAPFRIRAGEIEFSCNGDETVLDAAERAGYALPYSCRKGVCSTCEARLVEGSAICGADHHAGPQDGLRLCRAIPASDLVVAPSRIEKRELFPRKRLAARVFKLLRPTPDVALIHLRFAAGNRIKFRAGQYLRVLLADGGSRSFSMANPPHENDGVHLHVGRVPGGRFSEQVLASLQVGDRLEIEAPFGDFFLREDDGPIALLATGTGFAPIKAMIDDMIKRSRARPARLYWGVRHERDFYMAEVFEKWRRVAPWLDCVPVLSRPDGDWRGRRGFVQDALLEDCRDLSKWQVYACGNPAMVAAAKQDLTSRAGLPAPQFHADPFVPSGD